MMHMHSTPGPFATRAQPSPSGSVCRQATHRVGEGPAKQKLAPSCNLSTMAMLCYMRSACPPGSGRVRVKFGNLGDHPAARGPGEWSLETTGGTRVRTDG